MAVINITSSAKYAERVNAVINAYVPQYNKMFGLEQTSNNSWTYAYDENAYELDDEYMNSVDDFECELICSLQLAGIPENEYSTNVA